MTDNYGTEPHDHDSGHDEVLVHGQDMVHEAPSDYEFADDHGAAATEEHGDEHHTLSGDGPSERRSPVLAIAAAVAGVVLLGGVAWWQFGGSAAPSPANNVVASAGNPGLMSDVSSSGVPMTTVAPRSASSSTASPAPVGVASLGPSEPAAPTPVGAASASNTHMASTAPMAPQAPASMAPMGTMGIAASAAQAPAAPTSNNTGTDQKLTALNDRIDDLQKSIAQTADQLGQISNMVAASVANANAVAASSGKETQERLDRIEQQMAQIRHPAPVLAAPAALPGESQPAPAETSTPAVHRSARVAHVSVPRPKHVAEVHKAVAHESVKAASSSWVLRAASPGQAWVAPSSTSHDLKQVHVGDDIVGVGRVTSIQQQEGSWVVQGTKGIIQ